MEEWAPPKATPASRNDLDASIDLDKIQLPQNATRPALATGVTMVTLDLTNFDRSFSVAAPPAGQVTDAGGILSLGAA